MRSLFPSLPSPHSKCRFSPKKETISMVVSLLGTNRKLLKKKKKNPFLVCSPSLSVLYFSSEKKELLERREKSSTARFLDLA